MFSLFHRVRRSSVCRENCENFVKNGKLSCNWLIILVTMAKPISSHGKDKNSIFTARDENMVFLVKGKILVFHQYLYNKKNLQLKPRANGRNIFGPMLLNVICCIRFHSLLLFVTCGWDRSCCAKFETGHTF